MSAIEKARERAKKDFIGIIIFTIVFYVIAYFLNKENQWEFSKEPISIWFWAIIFFCLLGTFMVFQYYFLSESIKKITMKDYLLWFKYNNEDELIITKQALIPYSKNIKKGSNLTGVSWDKNNIKNALDELKNGALPISLVIPTIHLSSGKIPVFIPLIKMHGERFYLYFIDTNEIKSLLIILKNNSTKSEMTLNYPISKEIKFNAQDFSKLQNDMKDQRMRFGALHITDDIIKDLGQD